MLLTGHEDTHDTALRCGLVTTLTVTAAAAAVATTTTTTTTTTITITRLCLKNIYLNVYLFKYC